MGSRFTVLPVWILPLLMAAPPASGHHSFGAEFDRNQPVTLAGLVTKVEWQNPHVYIYMDVINEDGGYIYMDGRPLPDLDDPDLEPTYLGYSTGRWEGDTLIIESNGFNEKMWFAQGGIPHTRYLHLTERISRPNFETLRYEVTVDDPGAYTQAWTGGFDVAWNWQSWDGTDAGELREYFCQDNNRDVMHLIGN